MTESRVLYETGEEVENWPEMKIGPLPDTVIICHKCGTSDHLYREGYDLETGRVWYWCTRCNYYFKDVKEARNESGQ